jgi:hypothetical protein
VPEIVAAHTVLGFEMADHGLDGGPAAQLALDRRRHSSLLAGDNLHKSGSDPAYFSIGALTG